MRNRKIWLSVLLAGSLMVASCAGESASTTNGAGFDNNRTPDVTAQITAAAFAPPTIFDPHKSRNPNADPSYLSPVYDQLLRLDGDLDIQPMLATSWEMSPDGRTLTMDLRQGVTFHDGSVFDSSTVVANFERAKTLPGSTAVPLVAGVTSVTPQGPDRVEIAFSEPSYTFPYTLASKYNISSMVSPEAIETGQNIDREPAGSGPYKLVEFGQDRASFERIDSYWDQENLPDLAKATIIGIPDDNARLNALQSGQLDMASFRPNQSPAYRSLIDSNQFQSVTFSGQVYGLYLNVDRPGLDDPRVRKALSMAVNRESISAALGVPAAYQFYPEALDGHVPELEKNLYDPEAAKKLLAEAGYPDLTLDVILSTTEPADSVGTILQAQFAEVGVTLNLKKYAPTDARPAYRAGEADAFASALGMGGDPSVFVQEYIFGPDNPGQAPENVAAVAHEAMDTPMDDPARAEAFQEVSRVLDEEPLYILAVRVPIQFIATPHMMNVDEQSFAQLGTMVDIRPLSSTQEVS